MKTFTIIRSQKTDKFTMHATTCRVAVKHFERAEEGAIDYGAVSVEACLADMAQYAEECGWDATPEVKICKCAKG